MEERTEKFALKVGMKAQNFLKLLNGVTRGSSATVCFRAGNSQIYAVGAGHAENGRKSRELNSS